jgi:4-hydroxybenzoate polyprenyltransferase
MEYEYVDKLYNESLFSVSIIEENIQMIFYSLLAFFLPYFLGHPQWLVGIIVNAYLILGATYLKGYKLLPAILLPSIGVMMAGLIFGSYTIFLLYLIPFIWIGNAIYAYAYKHLQFVKMNKLFSIIGASGLKTAFLFLSALLLVTLGMIPALFLTAMGVLQLVTALAGGVVAIGIINGREQLIRNK